MVVFLVSAQERRVGSWWTWCAWRTVSSLSIGTSFRTKPREPPRKAGFRCSETSSLTNEQTAPERVHEKKRMPPCGSSKKQGLQGTEVRRPGQIHSAQPACRGRLACRSQRRRLGFLPSPACAAAQVWGRRVVCRRPVRLSRRTRALPQELKPSSAGSLLLGWERLRERTGRSSVRATR